MTGMAVLLLVRPIVRHRDRFAQRDERGDGWSADGEHLDRAREHRGSNAGFLLGHHLGSGRPRQSDGSVAAVAMMTWPVRSASRSRSNSDLRRRAALLQAGPVPTR